MLRAFALYFQLANLAEQHHRLRRRREDAHEGRVAARVARARRSSCSADVPEDELRAAARDVSLGSCSPRTRRRRRGGPSCSRTFASREQLAGSTTRCSRRSSSASVEERLAEEMTLLWQTDEVRHDRLRVSDEIRHGLWFFEHSLMEAATDCSTSGASGCRARRRRFAFGSWIGGDMDGNPAAGADDDRARRSSARARVALDALPRRGARARGRARVARARSSASRRSSRRRSRATSASCPSYAAEIGARNELEPYRRKLSFMWWRLGNDGYARRRTSCSTTCA